MDFTNLEGATIEIENLNEENPNLRCSLYVEFSNTRSLQKLYTNIVTKFKKYVEENFLLKCFNQDILYSLFEQIEFEPEMQVLNDLQVNIKIFSHPLFPTINIASALKSSHQTITRMNKIGYQHLYVLSPLEMENNSSNTSDLDMEFGESLLLKKKLKTYQKIIDDDELSSSMLPYHFENMTKITGTIVHVDILIFMDKIYCKILSKYLGLIYIEELLEEGEERDFNDVLFRLSKKSGKLYWIIQNFINTKLIRGFNNVCLTHSLPLWKNFNANVRAVISNENNKLLYVEPVETTNFYIDLGKDPTTLHYVEAISVITDNALKHKTHIIARYIYGKDVYCNVKLPLISIVPLYVLRYFTQCEIIENVLKIN